MLLGILSDTNDQRDRTDRAVAILQSAGAEVLIHCGDITRPDLVPLCTVLPCYFVFGNTDADTVPWLREAMLAHGAVCLEWGSEVMLGGKRVAVTHGHMGTDVRRLLAVEPDYLLSGHSHFADDCRAGPTRRINPGALHNASPFTVALLHLEADELRFIEVPR